MSLKQFSQFRPQIPNDLVDLLKPSGITVILQLIRDAYFELIETGVITLLMNENEITEEWSIRVKKHWRRGDLSLIPMDEKPDTTKKTSKQGKAPTIDFCFRHEWDKRSYFGVECKLLEANNQYLCDQYLSDGMQRFLDGRYSSKCSEGAMLGYIRQTSCQDVAKQLIKRISGLDGNPQLDKSERLHPFENYYVSMHNRLNEISIFTIHHLLFYFDVSVH